MSADPVWPSRAGEIVLWAEIVSIAILANYAFVPRAEGNQKARKCDCPTVLSSAALVFTAGAAGWILPAVGTNTEARLMLSSFLVIFVGTSTFVRPVLIASSIGKRWIAEWEIATNSMMVLASAAIIGFSAVGSPSVGSILRSGKVAAVLCAGAATLFIFRAGTLIVRGVLDKIGAVPHHRKTTESDEGQTLINTREFNRGRSIGNIERLLMVMVVGVGSYEALGFLVAAKGLIRAREFEDRDFAEYFIVGSLASVAVALIVGLVVRVTIPFLWLLSI